MNLSSRLEYTNFLINYELGGGYNVHFGTLGSFSMVLTKAELSLQRHMVKAMRPLSISVTLLKPGKIFTTRLSVFR